MVFDHKIAVFLWLLCVYLVISICAWYTCFTEIRCGWWFFFLSLLVVLLFFFINLCSLRLSIFVVDLNDCHYFASNDATLLRIVNCVQSCFPTSSMLPGNRLVAFFFISFFRFHWMFMFVLPQTISMQRNNKLMANDKESVMCIHQNSPAVPKPNNPNTFTHSVEQIRSNNQN